MNQPVAALIRRRTLIAGAAAAAGAIVPADAAMRRPSDSAGTGITVVAAENFYGDVIGQIAGSRISLTSIISDPNADPHEYASNTRDMAAIARARLVVVNGIGYDTFMSRLLTAAPNAARAVMDVARLAGKKQGDNLHIWYDPAVMPVFAKAVTEFFARLDPPNATPYRARLRQFEASYKVLTAKVSTMRSKFAGAPLGATEPLFDYMAAALGMKMLTAREFQKAVEDGQDPPARAIAEMEEQLGRHQIKTLMYNIQTVSPITERVRKDAVRLGVPVVGISETLPAGLSYQGWMTKQLIDLERALTT
jgi:zinc/manganese transport system substrate-binding protein